MKISRRGVMVAGLGVLGAGVLATPGLADVEKSEVPEDAIILVAELQVKAGEEVAVKEALLAMVSPTRKEPGCLCYNLHQSKKDKTVFMFYEQWASQAALDAHGKTPHMAAMRQAIDGKIEKGEATPYQYLK